MKQELYIAIESVPVYVASRLCEDTSGQLNVPGVTERIYEAGAGGFYKPREDFEPTHRSWQVDAKTRERADEIRALLEGQGWKIRDPSD